MTARIQGLEVVDVDFGQVMVGLVGIVCGLAVLIEPSFATRITGWRSPRWPASCSMAAGITLVAAGFADHLPTRVHLAAFAVAVLSGTAAVLIVHLGRAEPGPGDGPAGGPAVRDVRPSAPAGGRPPEPAEPPA